MMNRFVRACSAAAAVACAGALVHADQARRQPGSGSAQVPVEISVKAGGDTYQAKGQGTCTHAPKAAIYGVVSEMWTVRHSEGDRSLQLTLWKPADGSENMFSLFVGKTSISTVKGGSVSGGGTVTLAQTGKGGTFTIDAKGRGASGAAVTGTIKCEAFTPHIAEGGN